jgi:predicted amidohydrolase YtcJ
MGVEGAAELPRPQRLQDGSPADIRAFPAAFHCRRQERPRRVPDRCEPRRAQPQRACRCPLAPSNIGPRPCLQAQLQTRGPLALLCATRTIVKAIAQPRRRLQWLMKRRDEAQDVTIRRRKFLLTGAAAAVSAGAAAMSAGCGGGSTRRREAAELIFVGGPVVTVDRRNPRAEAIAVAGGAIVALGSTQDVMRFKGTSTKVVDLGGRALLPAFVEPHGHPATVASALGPPAVDVRPFVVPTGDGVIRALAERIATASPGEQILLYGVDVVLQADLRLPTKAELDAMAPRNPVLIVANSGHAAYGNTALFQLAGITEDAPNPAGAQYVRDSAGELTGEALEAAAVMALLEPYVRNVAEPKAYDNLRWAYAQLAAAGIATASDHAFTPAAAAAYLRAAAEPDVKVRVRAYEVATPALAKDPSQRAGSFAGAGEMFAKIGVKLWADGSPWQGNIFTSFPYLDTETTRRMGLEPHHHGAMNYSVEQMAALAAVFAEQGWQLSCHVHGDKAIDAVLDAYEHAHAAASTRPRLEHVGAMTPAQFQRAARLGVHPSLFIKHVFFWGDALIDELFGEDHGAHWMSAKSALDAGLKISFHNDGMVTPPDPLGNIATAVTRKAKGSGRVLAPEQRITVEQAVRAHTIDAAWQLHLDQEIGSLEVGKSADLVVLSADPHAVGADELKNITVEATYLRGRQTY